MQPRLLFLTSLAAALALGSASLAQDTRGTRATPGGKPPAAGTHGAAGGATTGAGRTGTSPNGRAGAHPGAPAGTKAGAETSVTGPVKGSPSGKTFTVGRRGGPVKVDASHAAVRQNGRFATRSDLKGGTMVTAKGTMNGSTLTANSVEIHGGKRGVAAGNGAGKGRTVTGTHAGGTHAGGTSKGSPDGKGTPTGTGTGAGAGAGAGAPRR